VQTIWSTCRFCMSFWFYFVQYHVFCSIDQQVLVFSDEFNYEFLETPCKVCICDQSCPFEYKITVAAVYSAGQVLHLRFEGIAKVGNTKSATFVQLRGVLNSVNASADGDFNTCCGARVCVSIVFSRSCFINWNTHSPLRLSSVNVFAINIYSNCPIL